MIFDVGIVVVEFGWDFELFFVVDFYVGDIEFLVMDDVFVVYFEGEVVCFGLVEDVVVFECVDVVYLNEVVVVGYVVIVDDEVLVEEFFFEFDLFVVVVFFLSVEWYGCCECENE